MANHHIITAALCMLLAAPSAADYLTSDLRARVEQLKANLPDIPTTPTNARARANLAWEWLNAYAIDGGYIPVDATLVIARILAPEPVDDAKIAALDGVIDEFTFLDDNPDALGELTADLGPFTARTHATVNMRYTVGAQAIQTGGGFMLARHFMANFGPWQVRDSGDANYITIKSNNPKVSFVASRVPLAGMHGGFRNSRPTLAFKVASGTLNPGDEVTITYGDTSGGSPGMLMPSFSSDRMPLPVYVSHASNSPYYSLPIQPLRITGQTIAGVHGFLPSVTAPGEAFDLSVRAEDTFFNRATGVIPGWRVLLNGEPWLKLDPTGAITTTETSITAPGVYFPTIESEDGSITGRANPIWVTAEDRPRIYWGDTHGHSGFAEGIGTPDRFMTWARDDARLDYVTHSEHDIWVDDAEWEELRQNVRDFTEEGKFIAYLGYEWTVNNVRGGHHNVLFRRPGAQVRVPAQFHPTLSSLYHGLRNNADPRDVVVIPHAHQAGDYRMNDPELEPLIEIMSQHGNFEWFGRMYLNHGHEVGFTAASDNHLSQPGYTAPLGGSLSQRGGLGAILANERTTDAIFDGMKNLQSYATTGDRIILDFEVNGTKMGKRGAFATGRDISGRVIGTAPIDSVTVIKNDEEIWQQTFLDVESDRIKRSDTFLLTFDSESHPHHAGDNPRGWRTWEGTLEVVNADLVSIEPYDASFPTQTVDISTDSPNRATFATKTRGDTSSYLVTLDNVSRTTKVVFDLVESLEIGGAPPIYREPQRVPATSFELGIRDMASGSVSHEQDVDHYTDSVRLRRIVTDGPRDVEFSLSDVGETQGDYYFVRVVQANDAIAWSSPVWIGGYKKR
jgi:hypothetical protein